jgi:hypothetical protein
VLGSVISISFVPGVGEHYAAASPADPRAMQRHIFREACQADTGAGMWVQRPPKRGGSLRPSKQIARVKTQ